MTVFKKEIGSAKEAESLLNDMKAGHNPIFSSIRISEFSDNSDVNPEEELEAQKWLLIYLSQMQKEGFNVSTYPISLIIGVI